MDWRSKIALKRKLAETSKFDENEPLREKVSKPPPPPIRVSMNKLAETHNQIFSGKVHGPLTSVTSFSNTTSQMDGILWNPFVTSNSIYVMDELLVETILCFCVKYLSVKDLKVLRSVSKGMYQLLSKTSKFRNGVRLHLNGDEDEFQLQVEEDFPIHPILLLVEKPGWVNIKFSNIDLEDEFLQHSNLFLKFIKQSCLRYLKSLTLSNVYCILGRLVELLTFCKKLEVLKIIDCPSLFCTGVELMNWAAFIPHFQKRLFRLKHFTMIDRNPNNPALDVQKAQGWMSSFGNLVTFEINVAGGHIPMSYILTVISKNSKTLRNLALVGMGELNEPGLNILSNLNLQSLHLGKLLIQDPSNRSLAHFLATQRQMESICLSDLSFHKNCFLSFRQMTHLREIIFQDVDLKMDGPTSQEVTVFRALENLTELKTIRLLNTNSNWKQSWMCMYNSIAGMEPKFVLRTLHVRNPHAFLLISRLPNAIIQGLEELIISDVGLNIEIGNSSYFLMLKKVFEMKSLTNLELINSPIEDEGFLTIHPNSFLVKYLIQQSLKVVNLSNTSFGDYMLTNVLTKLQNLEILHMDYTLVTFNGIVKFGNSKQQEGTTPKLKKFSVGNCHSLCLTAQGVVYLSHLLNCQFAYCPDDLIN